MRLPGHHTARRVGRWLTSRVTGGALILGYHRIAAVPDDPFGLCVSPEHFARHLEVLRRHAHPVSLARLVRDLPDRRLPKPAVAVTLDDGYVDALTAAKPLLEHYEVPATVFVVTGTPGAPFWWDRVHQAVRALPDVPEPYVLDLPGRLFTWRPPAAPTNAPVARRRLLMEIYRYVLPLPPAEREAVLEVLEDQAGPGPAPDAAGRALTEAERVDLAAGGQVEIGSHTVTHPRLPDLPPADQRRELEDSRQALEGQLGRPVRFFSYPNGAWSAGTEDLVRRAGLLAACGSWPDVARPAGNPFHLPRFWVSDRDGDAFERWLTRWLIS